MNYTQFNITNKKYDSLSSVIIENKRYYLRLTYNTSFDYWTLGIFTEGYEPIISGMKVVPCFPLNYYCTEDEMPDGIFAVIGTMTFVGENDFIDGVATLCYISNEEIENGGV